MFFHKYSEDRSEYTDEDRAKWAKHVFPPGYCRRVFFASLWRNYLAGLIPNFRDRPWISTAIVIEILASFVVVVAPFLLAKFVSRQDLSAWYYVFACTYVAAMIFNRVAAQLRVHWMRRKEIASLQSQLVASLKESYRDLKEVSNIKYSDDTEKVRYRIKKKMVECISKLVAIYLRSASDSFTVNVFVFQSNMEMQACARTEYEYEDKPELIDCRDTVLYFVATSCRTCILPSTEASWHPFKTVQHSGTGGKYLIPLTDWEGKDRFSIGVISIESNREFAFNTLAALQLENAISPFVSIIKLMIGSPPGRIKVNME